MEKQVQTEKEFLEDWKAIRNEYPTFARNYLSMQFILMEANSLGAISISKRICELLKYSSVLFKEYWIKKCVEVSGAERVPKWLDCIKNNPNPGSCFESDEDGWFDDPLVDWGELPPIPVDPHIRPL